MRKPGEESILRVKTRDVPAIYLCRRGPPARNLRHFLFFSPPFPPSSLSFPLFVLSARLSVRPSANILLLLTSLLISSSFFSLSLPSHASLSLSSCLSVRLLLRIYESTRLYKWTHCSFLGQRVARGSLLSFKKGVVFRCLMRLTAPPALQGNEIIENDTLHRWKGCWDIFVESK